MRSQLLRQLVFTLSMLVFGGFEAGLAYWLVGFIGVEGVAYSVLLCLFPGWVTIFASGLLRRSDLAILIVVLGMGFRLLFVLAGLMVVTTLRRDLGLQEFVAWVIAGYFVSLAIETWMVVVPSRPASVG